MNAVKKGMKQQNRKLLFKLLVATNAPIMCRDLCFEMRKRELVALL